MGGKFSKKISDRRSFLWVGSSSDTQQHPANDYQHHPAYPPSYLDSSQSYDPYSHNYQLHSQSYAPRYVTDAHQKRFQKDYSRIADNYRTLDQVSNALAEAGLESSNLIVGIDFTKSNEWTGRNSFNRQSLHHIGNLPNPYEQALSIVGRTLSSFDDDNLIPCFGFGDASTHDDNVFSFYSDDHPCNGFAEALSRYKEIVPQLRLSGPTSFAPIIEMAMAIVEHSGGQFHVLLIIADGQVTRSINTESGRLSSQEQKTIDAIVQASQYPLSIVLVGVGDGPWDLMREFDDNIPARAFDNFQFVNFTEIMLKNAPEAKKESLFAVSALMEIPSQYKAALELGILGHRTGQSPERVPLPTPVVNYGTTSSSSSNLTTPPKSVLHHSGYDTTSSTVPPASSTAWDSQGCPICLVKPKDMAFSCGHQTCCECGPSLENCPICRSPIKTRIRLY